MKSAVRKISSCNFTEIIDYDTRTNIYLRQTHTSDSTYLSTRGKTCKRRLCRNASKLKIDSCFTYKHVFLKMNFHKLCEDGEILFQTLTDTRLSIDKFSV